ncbi:ATP-binding cassette domain-containing protein [Youngiibacter multivorans]|uniref:Oligopeptide transport system ATP-binding protein n=1 Tax=Youngiibacter multivorans TaxID=937251 RepID=A0ABS4G6B6_9CLOT|nr:ATP-binding cassette domain-containing protein [Youngiibacter multivorans]MBP1920125.1 oligopeptide transport system ATP-binding protein [Youngiibacter multivorans]
MNDYIIEFNNVKKYFQLSHGGLGKNKKIVKAVDDVSFKVKRGVTFAVIGESGSGKSTMAKMIMKFEDVTEGKILVDGEDISAMKDKDNLKAYRRKVQIVHQDPTSSLNPRKTIKEIIEEPLIVHKIGDAKERLERVKELIQVVDLPLNYMDRYPHMLSGGQKQRVGIARAIALNSKLIVLDEPTSALDVSVQSKVIDLLKKIQKEFNLTYVFITHDLALVKNFADYVIIMQRGNLVEEGTTEELFNNPKQQYTRKLLKAIPVIGDDEQAFLDRIQLDDHTISM